jgi:23S rRNA pseudouridine2605 synthase
MHPSSEIEREYLVRVRGTPSPAVIEQLRQGVQLEDGPARFDRIEAESTEVSNAWYRVCLHEGRNREVRRMFEEVGFEVSRLTRIRYGTVTLPQDLRPGGARPLDSQSVADLLRLASPAGAPLAG